MKTKICKLSSTRLGCIITFLVGMCLLPSAQPAHAGDLKVHGNPHSGVVRQVFTVGFCAVQGLPGQDCSPRPRQSTVGILSAAGDPIGLFTTTADGRFHVHLPPGDYVLVLLDPEGEPYHPIFAQPVEVTVERKTLTTVTMAYDVGIR
jgi:hypothetical protein